MGTNRTLIFLLFAGSVILLLVASINLASLLATRVAGRSAEIAVRVALGAGKKRLLRQFLTEGLILSGIGAAAGIAVAFPLVRVIAHLAPPQIPRLASVSINGWALSFAIACLILTALLFGLTPLVLIREHGLQTVIRDGSSSISGSVRGRRVGRAFLMAEISATLALVVLTGTFAKSFRNLQNVNLGYKPDHVFTCAVFLNPIRYPNVPSHRRFYQDLMERLQSRPEVIAAGALVLRPLEGLVGWYSDYILPSQTPEEARQNPRANFEVVTPSYFKAIGTPLLAGRTFDEDEDESKPLAAVVSETIARAIAGTPSKALGRHFALGNRGNGDWTIVGIVADARYRRLNQVSGNIFLSYKQSAIGLRYLIVRTRLDPSAIGSIVRHEISQIDPLQSEGEEITMQEVVNVALAQDRFHSRMLLLFGVTALFLAAVGVFGVVSDFVVTRRKRDRDSDGAGSPASGNRQSRSAVRPVLDFVRRDHRHRGRDSLDNRYSLDAVRSESYRRAFDLQRLRRHSHSFVHCLCSSSFSSRKHKPQPSFVRINDFSGRDPRGAAAGFEDPAGVQRVRGRLPP